MGVIVDVRGRQLAFVSKDSPTPVRHGAIERPSVEGDTSGVVGQARVGLRRALVKRVEKGGIDEVILGTDPDSEGEATALLVLEAIDRSGLKPRVTRLARGLPAGSALEYLHRGVIEDALAGRVALRQPP